jgi:hypothetical protein
VPAETVPLNVLIAASASRSSCDFVLNCRPYFEVSRWTRQNVIAVITVLLDFYQASCDSSLPRCLVALSGSCALVMQRLTRLPPRSALTRATCLVFSLRSWPRWASSTICTLPVKPLALTINRSRPNLGVLAACCPVKPPHPTALVSSCVVRADTHTKSFFSVALLNFQNNL